MVRFLSSALLTSSVLLALPLRAEAVEECAPGRVMLILDKSSSMQTGLIDGVTKWSIAQDAIDQVASQFEANIELGLMIFP